MVLPDVDAWEIVRSGMIKFRAKASPIYLTRPLYLEFVEHLGKGRAELFRVMVVKLSKSVAPIADAMLKALQMENFREAAWG